MAKDKEGAVKTAGKGAPIEGGVPGQPKEKKVKLTKEERKAKREAARKALPSYTIPEGGLTSVPSDFDGKKFQPLEKENFADPAVWMEYRAAIVEARGHRMIEAAKKMRNTAIRQRQFGNEDTRKRVAKATKIVDQLGDLRIQLIRDGVDLTSVGMAPATPEEIEKSKLPVAAE